MYHQFPINGHLSCLQFFALQNSPAKPMYCIGLFIFFPVSVRVRKVEFAGSEGLVALLDMMDSPLSGLYYFVFPHILREGQFPSPYYFPLSMVLSLGILLLVFW